MKLQNKNIQNITFFNMNMQNKVFSERNHLKNRFSSLIRSDVDEYKYLRESGFGWMAVTWSRSPPPFFVGFYTLSTQEEKSISGAHAAAQGQMVAYVMITESPR